MKIALVGIGTIAREQHIPAVTAHPTLELAATASRNPDATMDGVPAYTSLADLLDAEPAIPCVSLCTPPQARFDDARRALQAGRHVMLEKPPGSSLSEVHALEDIAKEAGVTLFATWHSREAAAVDAARDWLATRELRRVRIDWKEDVRKWHPGQEWIWQPGGLGIFDPGINALSVMTAILPVPIHLSAATLHFPENRDTPIAADLHFVHPDGAEIEAHFDWRMDGGETWTVSIETSDGHAMLTEGGARFAVDGAEITGGEDQEYPRLYKRFAELVALNESEVDLAPMRHVADAFTLGKRHVVAPFHW
ncbi:MAG: Gfo/Idh/MocA family oxidoreductase [Pseudomonadota bacterium]